MHLLYIAASADFNRNHIERIAKELKSSFFVQPWSDISIISKLTGFFNGNAYNKGQGAYEFLNTYFTKQSITKYEIWTGAYNKDNKNLDYFVINLNQIQLLIVISLIIN